ncbi:MAG: methyltransferase domain-containing protein [Candidatus Methanofastidiosia archaeon]
MACGTGLEDLYLKKSFHVTGIDIHTGVLDIARNRNPDVTYTKGDMRTITIGNPFDVIICFDAMAYLSRKDFERTVKSFYRYVKKGGVLIFYIDTIKEHYHPETLVTKKLDKDLHVTLIEDSYKINTKIELYLIIIVRHNESFIYTDKHYLTVFNISEITSMIKDTGFKLDIYASKEHTFSLDKYTGKPEEFPIFVCTK